MEAAWAQNAEGKAVHFSLAGTNIIMGFCDIAPGDGKHARVRSDQILLGYIFLFGPCHEMRLSLKLSNIIAGDQFKAEAYHFIP